MTNKHKMFFGLVTFVLSLLILVSFNSCENILNNSNNTTNVITNTGNEPITNVINEGTNIIIITRVSHL